MAISKMTDDLNIIQALSDLPNAEDGLSADDLKKKFDESGLTIQGYLNNTLVPQIDAEHIPFDKTTAIEAETVQSAIENVQAQVRDAASGSIVNGSVTKEKLTDTLLDRTYGGLAWVSMDTPGEDDNPENDFPVGQTWIRPSFTVVNAALASWTGTGCTVEAESDTVTITGLSQSASVVATQTVTSLGQAGDKIRVLVYLDEKDSEITSLTVNVTTNGVVNGIGKSLTSGLNVIRSNLPTGGSFSVRITATWPSSSLADGKVVLKNFTIVNLDNVRRQNPDAKDIASWNDYLVDKLPFASYYSKRVTYRQVANGQWELADAEVLPVENGGTGLNELEANKYMKTNSNGEISFLTAEQVNIDLGAKKFVTGTYEGTGNERSITLPVEPMLLVIYNKDGAYVQSDMGVYTAMDSPAVLANGATKTEVWQTGDSNGVFVPAVTLLGSTLKFFRSSGQASVGGAYLCNRSGITYHWIAIV